MPTPTPDNGVTPRVPVTILTGFLGAGKTTLLNRVLAGQHGRQIAVLVNDFGAVNIDERLIERQTDDVVSLANGCICCSLSDGLVMAVARLLRREPPPDHIVIETSGIADPIEVAAAFTDPNLQPYAPLDGIVTVVDAELAPTLDGDASALALRQVAAADVAVINKIDLVDDAGRVRAHDWVGSAGRRTRVIEASQATVPLELLFDIDGGRAADRPERRPDSDGEPPFDVYTFDSETPIPMARLHSLLQSLPSTVFRVKGTVTLAERPGHWCVLQATGRRAALTVGDAWEERSPSSQIVFIGSPGGVDGQLIRRQLER